MGLLLHCHEVVVVAPWTQSMLLERLQVLAARVIEALVRGIVAEVGVVACCLRVREPQALAARCARISRGIGSALLRNT